MVVQRRKRRGAASVTRRNTSGASMYLLSSCRNAPSNKYISAQKISSMALGKKTSGVRLGSELSNLARMRTG
jgi:hypothetical protein